MDIHHPWRETPGLPEHCLFLKMYFGACFLIVFPLLMTSLCCLRFMNITSFPLKIVATKAFFKYKFNRIFLKWKFQVIISNKDRFEKEVSTGICGYMFCRKNFQPPHSSQKAFWNMYTGGIWGSPRPLQTYNAEISKCCNWRKHMQIEKTPAN